LTPAALRAELGALRGGELRDELPYGYAWFLALAAERERASGRRDLRPLASEAARQLSSWTRSLSRREIVAHLAAPDYSNLSWALLNVLEWSTFRRDTRAVAAWRTFIRTHVTPTVTSGYCASRDREERGGFLPPCLLRMMVAVRGASTARQAARVRTALEDHYRKWRPLEPDEIFGHTAGLNFSRSWGLWSSFVATRDRRYRADFQAHMTALLSQPRYWRENYQRYAHWVAQFGVYALALTYGRP
jgi:hypothetical protein